MVDDLVSVPAGIPDALLSACGERNHAWHADARSQVHGPGVRPQKHAAHARARPRSPRREPPTQVHLGPAQSCAANSLTSASSPAPTSASPCSGYRFASRPSSARQFSLPQSLACIFVPGPQTINGRSRRSTQSRRSRRCAPPRSISRSQLAGSFSLALPRAPIRRASRCASDSHISVAASNRRSHLGLICRADDVAHAAEAEEHEVAAHEVPGAQIGKQQQHIRFESPDRQSNAEKFDRVSRAHPVAHIAVDQPRFSQDRSSGWRFGAHWKIGQQAALRLWEAACNQMKAWQGDHHVTQTAQPVNQHFLDRRLSRQSPSVKRYSRYLRF